MEILTSEKIQLHSRVGKRGQIAVEELEKLVI